MGSTKNTKGSSGASAPGIIGWGWPSAPPQTASEKLWERYYLSCERIAAAVSPKNTAGTRTQSTAKHASAASTGAPAKGKSQASQKAAPVEPTPPAANKSNKTGSSLSTKKSGAARRKARAAKASLSAYSGESSAPSGAVLGEVDSSDDSSDGEEEATPATVEKAPPQHSIPRKPVPTRLPKATRANAADIVGYCTHASSARERRPKLTERVMLLHSKNDQTYEWNEPPPNVQPMERGSCNGRWTYTNTGKWVACGISCTCSNTDVKSDTTGSTVRDEACIDVTGAARVEGTFIDGPTPAADQAISVAGPSGAVNETVTNKANRKPDQKRVRIDSSKGDSTKKYRPRRLH